MNTGISILRGLAAFGIVGCHLLLSPRTDAGWLATNLCDLNVGVFAALSGYLMALSKPLSWREYARKRVLRILPVYFVWTIVCLCASAAFQCLADGAVKPGYGELEWWYYVVFWGSAATHLWFLAALFYAQVALWPILPRIRKSALVVASLGLVALPLVVKCWYAFYPIRLLGFVLLGYGLSGLDRTLLERWRLAVLIVFAGAVALHLWTWPFPTAFIKDWIVVVPMVLFFISIPAVLSVRLAKVGSFLGTTSMGVYLLHPLFTKALGIAVRRMFDAPYGVSAVLLDWIASWGVALLLTVLVMRSKRFSWIVK